jgi:hypothetical protein
MINQDYFFSSFFAEAEKRMQKLHFNFQKAFPAEHLFFRFVSCLPAGVQALVLMLQPTFSRTATALRTSLTLHES